MNIFDRNLDNFPLIIPLKKCSNGIPFTSFCGFLQICGQPYRINLMVPDTSGLKQARLECEWRLQHKLSHKTGLIQQRLQVVKSVTEFLKELVLISESVLKPGQLEPELWSQHNCHILQQIEELGWKFLKNINEDFSTIELGFSDAADRWHMLKLSFNTQDLSLPPLTKTTLPEKFNIQWTNKTRLKQVWQQFEMAVESYQAFWNMMAEIDENCWILEPEQLSLSCTYRRISLGPNISLHIKVNCRLPQALPDCRLLGYETVVGELREKLNINLHRWDMERSLLNNLEEVLDMDFPTPSDTRLEELTVDCGICYCHRLNDEIPEVLCEEKRCAKPFHRSCLYEWLRSLPSRQSFNTLFGDCPLCGSSIRVKIPAT